MVNGICFFGGLAIAAVPVFTGFVRGHPVTASENPGLVFGWFGSYLVVILMFGVIRIAAPLKVASELRAGYSTLPLATLSVDIRDPRDGRILLPAGEGPRKGIFRIGELRRGAAVPVDRPLAPTPQPPPPLVELERPPGGGGVVWSRRWLSSFQQVVAAAEPDALLVGALREPLTESVVSQYQPGARLHYTYLLAVRPTGLEFWNDGERVALIARIPRTAVTAVDQVEIQNDRLLIAGIAISVLDPHGIPTEVQLLALRPRHPLLFVARSDVPALAESMRRALGLASV